jgi:Tfp pilus assembly protein PilP
MRLAKKSRTILPLAFSAVLATCAMAQDHPNIQPNAVRDQLQQSSTGSKPQANSPAAAPSPAKTPAPSAIKPTAKTSAQVPPAPGKTPAKQPVAAPAKTMVDAKAGMKPIADAKAATKPATDSKAGVKPVAETKAGTKPAATDPKAVLKPTSVDPAKAPFVKPPEEKAVARRDPFDTLLSKARSGTDPPENLPPGKAGLIIETLHINGIVNSPTGTVAVVSNSQQRVYFLRDGDKLYDGSVQKISLDGITFLETGKDAFGKPLERTVTKNLYQISGEKQ